MLFLIKMGLGVDMIFDWKILTKMFNRIKHEHTSFSNGINLMQNFVGKLFVNGTRGFARNKKGSSWI